MSLLFQISSYALSPGYILAFTMPPPSTLQIGDDLLPCPATPPRSQPPRTRDNQKVIPRTGAHFLTPQKRRLGGKKDQVLVSRPGDTRTLALLARLRALESHASTPPPPPEDALPPDLEPEPFEQEIPVQEPSDASPPAKRSKRLLPDAEAHKTFDRWRALIPKLVPALLQYMQTSYRQPSTSCTRVELFCEASSCSTRGVNILCLYWSRKS